MKEKFFCECKSPARHLRNLIAHQARWLTWGQRVLKFFYRFGGEIDRLDFPQMISVRGCSPYEASYSYSASRIDSKLYREVRHLSEMLLSFRVGKNLNFLTRMLDTPVDPPRLRKFFALLRLGIVRTTGDRRCALNAPVYAARRDDGFPLHTDFFLTERLWLIFDDVPRGQRGASLFLSMESLLDIADTSESPLATRLRALAKKHVTSDSFDEFYSLLHSKNAWQAEIEPKLKRAQGQIKLLRGEGYIVNDRYWLHGRQPLFGPVSRFRFHRLVFGLLDSASH